MARKIWVTAFMALMPTACITGQWMVDGDAVSLFWDDGTEDTAVLIPNEHPGDVGEDVSTLSLNGTDLLFNNRW